MFFVNPFDPKSSVLQIIRQVVDRVIWEHLARPGSNHSQFEKWELWIWAWNRVWHKTEVKGSNAIVLKSVPAPKSSHLANFYESLGEVGHHIPGGQTMTNIHTAENVEKSWKYNSHQFAHKCKNARVPLLQGKIGVHRCLLFQFWDLNTTKVNSSSYF